MSCLGPGSGIGAPRHHGRDRGNRGPYSEAGDALEEPASDGDSVAHWLCVDPGVAPHFQVATRKLAEHDTFRLIEEEEGVRATDECPLPKIAIRVNAMLSILGDLGLLDREDDGYSVSAQTEAWYRQQMRRLG